MSGRQVGRVAALVAVACTFGACATSGTPASTGAAAEAAPVGIAASKLTAALVPAGGNVRGSIDIDSGVEPNKSRVRIELRGASVGAEHGWQVRTGRCGETTQVVGSPAVYRAITVRGDGTADMTVTIPIVLDGSRQYNVALLANRTDLDGVMACGNLTAR
jgi:hypothetical protein